MKACNLKVNYLKEPLGLQDAPRFFWNCEGGITQIAYRSIYGEVRSEWERKGKKITYRISVPSNCEADICLEGQDTVHVKTGEYTYEI